MGAAALQTPELMLEQSEAQALAHAIGTVQSYYPVSIDPKTLAWANLCMVAGAVYGTRAIAIYARKKNEHAPRQPLNSGGDNVRPMKPGGGFDPMSVQAGKPLS